jgi:hypothetical protein
MRRRRGPGLIGTAVVVGGAAHMGAKSAQRSQAAAAGQSAEQAEMAQKAAAYDQMQQQAQIDAAAAAAVAAQSAPPPPAPAPAGANAADPVEELQKLADMKAQGLLTDEEFAAMKAKILAG